MSKPLTLATRLTSSLPRPLSSPSLLALPSSPLFLSPTSPHRSYTVTKPFLHGGPHVDKGTAKHVHITFDRPKGGPVELDAYVGQTLLQLAHNNGDDVTLEGACEGVCACSTCHCIMTEDLFDTLPEASEDEEDMLDLAFGLTPTSRLGCQIVITEDMEGAVIKLPSATRNFYVDGHVPVPH